MLLWLAMRYFRLAPLCCELMLTVRARTHTLAPPPRIAQSLPRHRIGASEETADGSEGRESGRAPPALGPNSLKEPPPVRAA